MVPFRAVGSVAWLASLALGTGAVAASLDMAARWQRPPSEGQVVFRRRCAVCHSNDERSGQGPGLGGLLGRAAGSAAGFAYTRALRESGLVWDAATIDRFLADPGALVRGTAMPVAVTVASERRALVGYLTTLRAGQAALPASTPAAPDDAPPFGSWQSDRPGKRHRIEIDDLPAPYRSPSVRNGPSVVPAPEGVAPRVPAGFSVARFAEGLDQPRIVRVAPNGDVFIAESAAGRIRVLRARDGAARPDRIEVFAEGLDRPFGIAFYPRGDDPRWVYVANTSSIVRFPYRSGDLRAGGPAQTILPHLVDHEGGHWTRDIVFSLDGRTMFVSVGSASNVAEGMPKRSAAENAAWEATHGTGATWGDETNRADVLAFDPEGQGGRVFATGIRNCVGMALSASGTLFCATNERDGLGDNLVPDYVTRVAPRSFFGWPWYYLGRHEDPRHAGERPELAAHVDVPDVLVQPHSAPLGITFYDGTAFPSEYRGDLFVACHGSWNRSTRTGPKVIVVRMQGGVPLGDYDDFLTGFVVDPDHVWGRPVGVAAAHDGSLLVTEDANGTVWRVAR